MYQHGPAVDGPGAPGASHGQERGLPGGVDQVHHPVAGQQGLGSQVYDRGPLMVDAEQSVMSEHGVVAIQALWREAMH